MWRKRCPHALLVGMPTSAATVEKSMEVSQKIKKETPYDPIIPLSCVYPGKNETQLYAPLCLVEHYLQ